QSDGDLRRTGEWQPVLHERYVGPVVDRDAKLGATQSQRTVASREIRSRGRLRPGARSHVDSGGPKWDEHIQRLVGSVVLGYAGLESSGADASGSSALRGLGDLRCDPGSHAGGRGTRVQHLSLQDLRRGLVLVAEGPAHVESAESGWHSTGKPFLFQHGLRA